MTDKEAEWDANVPCGRPECSCATWERALPAAGEPFETRSCRVCNGEPIAAWPPEQGGGPTHHTCHPGEERAERTAEKQRSRDADAAALASGGKTREQLREENSHFREIAHEPIQWDRMKADAAEREHVAMLTKYAGIPGTPYHAAVCFALDAIRERADAARVATERAEKAAQERIANVHSAAYRDGVTNGTEAERARVLAVEPERSGMPSVDLNEWRERIASGEPAK